MRCCVREDRNNYGHPGHTHRDYLDHRHRSATAE